MKGESGRYIVCAVHPDVTDRPQQAEFVIRRVEVSPGVINVSIPYNYEQEVGIGVITGKESSVHNVAVVYDESDQAGGIYPDGIHITVPDVISEVLSSRSVNLPVKIWADNSADKDSSLRLRVISDEGILGYVVINGHFSEAEPSLSYEPSYIETGVSKGDVGVEHVRITNMGLGAIRGIEYEILKEDHGPAPAWVHVNAPSVEELNVGDSIDLGLSFSPDDTVGDGIYGFILRVWGENYSGDEYHVYVSVTESGKGGVLIKVTDIYTGTLNENNELIQGVKGARVKIQNEEVPTIGADGVTDEFGEVVFDDLPAGRYSFRVSADNHQDYTGRMWIKPGVTGTEEVFLEYNLVSVEWEVREITIEDRYEIVLSMTFETDVPAPVVVIEPGSVNLPDMKKGDVFNGEFKIKNYGLIRADNLKFNIPEGDEHLIFELPEALPESLDAGEEVVIPYRVRCVQSLSPEGDGTGGGCNRYSSCIGVSYDWVCANGTKSGSSINFCMFYLKGRCESSKTVPVIARGGVSYEYGGRGRSGWPSPRPRPTQIKGIKCLPVPDRKESFCDVCERIRESQKHYFEDVASSVNLLMREYTLDHEDMWVKVQGGRIGIERSYYGNTWHMGYVEDGLTFNRNAYSGGIDEIDRGGVKYKKRSSISDIYENGIYRIIPDEAGYRWEDRRGNWKEYDEDGNLLSWGNRNGVIGRLIYDGDIITGIMDRDGHQVLWFEHDGDGKITAVYDETGRRVEYTYTDGNLTQVRDILGNITEYAYDGNNRLIKVTDAEGRVTEIGYDTYGNVSSVEDGDGRRWEFDYDYDRSRREYYARVIRPSGMVKEVWYDSDGRARRVDIDGKTRVKISMDGEDEVVEDGSGRVTRYEYDERGNLRKVIYPDGSTIEYEYDLRINRKIREVNERGIVTVYEYDENGNMVRKEEAKGTGLERVYEYEYDTDGNLVKEVRPGGAVIHMDYDDRGNMVELTDPEGNTSQYGYDIMGNMVFKRDALGNLWQYEYDGMGHLVKVTDPKGNITRYEYDSSGRKIREVYPDGSSRSYEYDGRGNLVKAVDQAGAETVMEYNSDNRLIRQSDPEGRITEYDYDKEGRLIKVVDGEGNEIRMEYENETTGDGCSSCGSGMSKDKPSRIIYPTYERRVLYDERGRKVEEREVVSEEEQYITGYAYDASGNLIEKTDREGNSTYYEYDELNRLIAVIDPMGNRTEYGYDGRDNLILIRDGNGNETHFEYDRNNRLIKETRPMGEETRYTYDASGNLIEKEDAKGQKICYDYDELGRLIKIRYYNSGDYNNPVRVVNFTYDVMGRMISYSDGITSGTYEYDLTGRKVKEVINYGPFTKEIRYSYYKNGLKKSMTYPDGTEYSYTYDKANRLKAISIPGVGDITVPEYNWVKPKEMILPGGSKKEYSYDPIMRVKEIVSRDSGQNVIMDYRYTYDREGNILSKETEHGNYIYSYDELYRLIMSDNPGDNDEYYTYDAVGNRLTDGNNNQYTYNANNELITRDGTTYSYDQNGNTIEIDYSTGVTKFVYDVNNRLIKVKDGDDNTIAEYYYDPFGRRLWKEVRGVRTYFMYGDEGLIGEYDEYGEEIRSYGYKPNSTWTTDPVFMKQNGNYYFYHNDHLGTPQKLTAINGAVVWSAKYEAFGETVIDSNSTIINKLRFPGQYYDEETGLHYNHHRYYDPRIGRYIKPDPSHFMQPLEIGVFYHIPFILLSPQQLNPFPYVQNDPINILDSRGLKGIGVGGYYGGGAEFSYNVTICCEDDKKYKVKLLTVCGGVGLGISGKIPLGISTSLDGISSRRGCPKTHYYFKHEISFVYRSIDVQFDRDGPSVGLDFGRKGIATVWAFCSDTVISKKLIGKCCNN